MIYFDHAASSYPKPKAVSEAMIAAVTEYGANPGRGGHALARKAKSVIDETRQNLAQMFAVPSSKHVWFYQNATMALNQALSGFPFVEGDHVVTTVFEHNSMIRPLERLKQTKKIEVTYVMANEEGIITAEAMKAACTKRTILFALTHASNVTGALLPLNEISKIAQESGVRVLLDASQTAGKVSIELERDCIDLLAFAGHKSMLGPQGTGVLISRQDYGLEPLVVGGTGNFSEERMQPEAWPERYEAGTLNTPGIAGLLAGINEIKQLTIEKITEHEKKLTEHCERQLRAMERVTVYGPEDPLKKVAVIAFQMENVASHELAMILDEHYGIAVRAGLHCAPRIHEHLHTSESGLVRISFGIYNNEDEVNTFIQALKEIDEAFMLA